MSMFFSRTAIISVWLVVFALFAFFALPMPVGMAALLLIAGVAVPVIILTLLKETPPTVAEVLHHVEASGRDASVGSNRIVARGNRHD